MSIYIIILVCPPGRHLCNDTTQCIDITQVCDGIIDCFDQSDENNCTECEPDKYRCADQTCIESYFVCDGRKDCSDFDDEKCGKFYFLIYYHISGSL